MDRRCARFDERPSPSGTVALSPVVHLLGARPELAGAVSLSVPFAPYSLPLLSRSSLIVSTTASQPKAG